MPLMGIRKPFVNADGTTAIAVANQDTIYTNSVKIEEAEFFGLELTGESTPDMKVELEQSNTDPTIRASDATSVVAEGVSAIVSNFTSTTKKMYSLSPTPSSYMRLKITGNAGNGASAKITATMFLQSHVGH